MLNFKRYLTEIRAISNKIRWKQWPPKVETRAARILTAEAEISDIDYDSLLRIANRQQDTSTVQDLENERQHQAITVTVNVELDFVPNPREHYIGQMGAEKWAKVKIVSSTRSQSSHIVDMEINDLVNRDYENTEVKLAIVQAVSYAIKTQNLKRVFFYHEPRQGSRFDRWLRGLFESIKRDVGWSRGMRIDQFLPNIESGNNRYSRGREDRLVIESSDAGRISWYQWERPSDTPERGEPDYQGASSMGRSDAEISRDEVGPTTTKSIDDVLADIEAALADND